MTTAEALGNSGGTQAKTGVAVGVCTFKRRDSLLRTLEHVAVSAQQLAEPVAIVVVDNDGNDASVAEAVAAFGARSGLVVHYLIERTPGISAARNAIFAKADDLSVRFLAMLDDDEWPSPGWLTELLKTQAATGAAVVGGPVNPVFPESAQQLRRYARYWAVQAQAIDGKPFVFCSCNFLIDLAAIASEPRPLFEEAYGLSGGGDTVFFRQLFVKGYPMAWTEAAFLYEEVSPSRASVRWIRQRRYRVGNHMAHLESTESRLRPVLKSLGMVARLAVYPLLRREPESPWMGWLLEFDKVRGRFASHFGSMFVEYARPPAPGEKACR